MLLTLLSMSALAAAPKVVAEWARGAARLQVVAPEGEKLAEGAPADLVAWVAGARTRLETDSAGLERGVLLAVPQEGGRVEGELTLSVCALDGTQCRVLELTFAGDLAGKRGKEVVLDTADPRKRQSHDGDLDAALAAAQGSGRLVLLDFGAIWCPPCNRMNAEVFDDPARADALGPFTVVRVDADAQESWSLKDRYEVGGYPTLVVTTAAGREIGRKVGYNNAEDTLAWLADTGGLSPLESLPSAQTLAPAEAAAAALRLIRAERADDAQPYLEQAELALTSVPSGEVEDGWLVDDPVFREARFLLSPSADDARWLLTEAPEGWPRWLFDVVKLADSEPELAPTLQAFHRAQIPRAETDAAAELLWAAAMGADETQAPLLYAAAAQLVAATLTGDPWRDRGRWQDLASARERAGDIEGAAIVLRQAAAQYPDEFTFHYALSGVLQRAERFEEAEAPGRRALEVAYGDNHLRAAGRLARTLHGLDRTDEALSLVRKVRADAPEPDAELAVRTTRYLDGLDALVAELEAPPEPPTEPTGDTDTPPAEP